MKLNKKMGIAFLAVTLIASGCTKTFEKYAVNPNQPTAVPAYLLLRQIENSIMVFPGGDEDKFSQYTLSTYTYYGTNEYWSGSTSMNYGILNNITAMETEAAKTSTDPNAVNPYGALAKFFKAYLFIDMTLKFGDIPMSDALKGLASPQV